MTRDEILALVDKLNYTIDCIGDIQFELSAGDYLVAENAKRSVQDVRFELIELAGRDNN